MRTNETSLRKGQGLGLLLAPRCRRLDTDLVVTWWGSWWGSFPQTKATRREDGVMGSSVLTLRLCSEASS